jgi:hypothetical protein
MNTIDLIFLEVDMSDSRKTTCGACDVAKSQLNAALEFVHPILAEAGYEIRVNHITVSTEEQARELNFIGSPTLRVASTEVFPRHISDSEDRLWSWGGKEFSDPPVGLFVDLILRGVRTEKASFVNQPVREIPNYLKRFLQSDKPKPASACGSCS